MTGDYFRGRSRLETQTVVVPVAEVCGGEVRAMGTAFFVSTLGILVTARHVVDEMVPEDAPEGRVLGRPGHRLVVVVPSHPSDAPAVVQTVPVLQVSLDTSISDVAVLRVDMSQFPAVMLPYLLPWPIAYIRPASGEGCEVIGYDEMTVGGVDPSGESPVAAWTQRLTPERGQVRELHPGGRDRGRLARHPCFATTMSTKGGMSGGPVFTERGLCGVLSSGGPDPYSIASFIATCFYLKLDCDVGDGTQEFRVLDLINKGYIHASGTNFELENTGEGYTITWPEGEDGIPRIP